MTTSLNCLVCGLIFKFFLQRERERVRENDRLIHRHCAFQQGRLTSGECVAQQCSAARLNLRFSGQSAGALCELKSIVEIKFAFD